MVTNIISANPAIAQVNIYIRMPDLIIMGFRLTNDCKRIMTCNPIFYSRHFGGNIVNLEIFDKWIRLLYILP